MYLLTEKHSDLTTMYGISKETWIIGLYQSKEEAINALKTLDVKLAYYKPGEIVPVLSEENLEYVTSDTGIIIADIPIENDEEEHVERRIYPMTVGTQDQPLLVEYAHYEE